MFGLVMPAFLFRVELHRSNYRCELDTVKLDFLIGFR